MAMKATRIKTAVFDQAVNDLYDEGRLFDRDEAFKALQWAHLDLEDGDGWQARVNSMDAEEMAEFIVSYVLDPMDEVNLALTDKEGNNADPEDVKWASAEFADAEDE